MDKLACVSFYNIHLPVLYRVFSGVAGLALVSAAMYCNPLSAAAHNAIWNGSQSADWDQDSNWNGNTAPQNGANNNVTINDSASNPVLVNGIAFTGGTFNIGSNAGASGSLILSGNSAFQLRAANIGTSGSGTLTITDSTLTTTSTVSIGSSQQGHLIISGQHAKLAVTGSSSHLNIGNSNGGYGRVDILDGAKIEAHNVSLGNLNGSGDLVVSGGGSALIIEGRDLSAGGRSGNVSIEVSGGGLIAINGDFARPPDSYGLLQLVSNPGTSTKLLITGSGSEISTTGDGLIGEFGTVSARVEKHGLLDIGNNLIVGIGAGNLTLSENSIVKTRGDTVIGIGQGRGTVTISGGSMLSSGGEVYIAIGDNAKGELNIGSAADGEAAPAGLLNVSKINFGLGDSRLVFNHTSDGETGPYEFAQQIEGPGTIEHYAGLTRFSALDNTAFTGTTTVFGGTMRVDGTLGGTINVEANSRLQGIGTVGSVINRGIIAPGNSIGMLTSEGIRIVEVGGSSDGTFNLLSDYIHNGEKAVVAGAHAYKLYQGATSAPADGHWYLRSRLQPGSPVGPTDPSDPTDPVVPRPESQRKPAGTPWYDARSRKFMAECRRHAKPCARLRYCESLL
ncbi:hypothetical protein [Falsochrobactrum tianjinense]|uniref:hypothetical protein n=1 Tax=Falsochrobactrum tianjinense TaxID=2706015 RepID=UPI0020C83939|nr:hypothetical protein [Falsochrobactrum sp. TDYN1]